MGDLSKNNGVDPAGSTPHDVGQQPGGVLVQSARDQRVVQWLVDQVGKEEVEKACKGLSGRHPYPSNIAKALGLNPPESLQFTRSESAREHIVKAKSILRGIKSASE